MGKAVKSIFGGAKTPKAPAPPPPPTPDTKSEDLAREANEQRMRAAQAGRASTILTGGEGVDEDVQTAKKKLLGA